MSYKLVLHVSRDQHRCCKNILCKRLADRPLKGVEIQGHRAHPKVNPLVRGMDSCNVAGALLVPGSPWAERHSRCRRECTEAIFLETTRQSVESECRWNHGSPSGATV